MIKLLLSRVTNRSSGSCICDELTGKKVIRNCGAKTKRLFPLTENREKARRGSLINSGNFRWCDAGYLRGKNGAFAKKKGRDRTGQAWIFEGESTYCRHCFFVAWDALARQVDAGFPGFRNPSMGFLRGNLPQRVNLPQKQGRSV
jgi:hypothetical protein